MNIRRVATGLGATAFTLAVAGGAGTPPASAQPLAPVGSGPPVISTVAGSGHIGFGGDGGPATAARLTLPMGLAEDAAGNLYIADTLNFRVRRVTVNGVISTVAGTGQPGFSGDGGPATQARLSSPKSPAVDSSGNLYIADSGNNRIRRVTPAGVISTVAGSATCGPGGDGGPANLAQLCRPEAVAIDRGANLYIADTGNNEIRKVTSNGIMTTQAGSGRAGSSGDGGPATSARLDRPTGIAVDSLHAVFIADTGNNKIRKVDPAGSIHTFAGTGMVGFGGDGGPATRAKLNHPSGVGVDPLGRVYIADTLNVRIRVVSPTGDIFTYAGTGIPGYSGDGGPATGARINASYGDLAVDANNVFFTDTINERVRRIQGGPPPDIPESPLAVLLPISAVVLIVGGYLLVRRRSGSGVVAA